MQKLLGGNKKYNADELVEKIKKNLDVLADNSSDEKAKEKARIDSQKYLERVRDLFQQSNQSGDTGNDQVAKLKKNLNENHGLIEKFIMILPKVTFESKKYIQFTISYLVRKPMENNQMAKFISERKDLLEILVKNYEKQASEIALNSGQILRDCIRHLSIAKLVLENHYLSLVEFSNVSSFDIQSDAFSTLKELLTTHKQMVRDYVSNNYDSFIEIYTSKLIQSENYVTKRQSIKLLSDFLLDRVNLKIMTRYISDPENLKAIMQLLLDESESIKFEAFHVFKVFAANPHKSKPVLKLLIINKRNLTEFLNNFQSDQRQDDENFHEERRYLADLIENLKMPTSVKEGQQQSVAEKDGK